VDWSRPENKRFFIQEKVDGSQLSFRVDASTLQVDFYNKTTPHQGDGGSVFRSAMHLIRELASQGLFNPDLTYHGEAFQHPRHNVVVYERMPRYYCILYDIQCNKDKRFFDWNELEAEGGRIGMEVTQTIWPLSDKDDWQTKFGFTRSREELEAMTPHQLVQLLLGKIQDGTLKSCLGGEGVFSVLISSLWLFSFFFDGQVRLRGSCSSIRTW
jgi:hypothetical protein